MWRGTRRLFTSAPEGLPKKSKGPLIGGLAVVSGFGVYGYYQYQEYLAKKQAKEISDQVKNLMSQHAEPVLPTIEELKSIADKPTDQEPEKPVETKEVVPEEAKNTDEPAKQGVISQKDSAEPVKPENPQADTSEARAPEPTLAFQPPLPSIVIALPSVVEAPPQTSQDTKLSSLISELQTSLEKAREEIKEEQSKREEELLKRMEESLSTMISEILPRVTQAQEGKSTAHVLASRLSYSEATPQELQNQVEELIRAYETRIEGLGLRNYDVFYERLQAQRKKWKRKLQAVTDQLTYEQLASIEKRDAEWRSILDGELTRAETHFIEQGRIDEAYARQQSELELTIRHQQEIHDITESLRKATEVRIAQIAEIIAKIKEMEAVQAEYFTIIEKLRQVHEVHIHVENLQRTLNFDSGSLTQDLEYLRRIAESDPVVSEALGALSSVHSDLVQRGVPTMSQLSQKLTTASKRARTAALMKAKTLTNYALASVASWLIPTNIWTVDENNTLSVLKAAEELLRMGDLAGTERALTSLSGFPREEVEGFLQDLKLRLQVVLALESLSVNTLAVVNSLIAPKVTKRLCAI